MESVAPYPGLAHRARDGEELSDIRLTVMECCVEAGDLCDLWKSAPEDADRLQVVRLMQRGEWDQPFQRLECVFLDPDGLGVRFAAMDYSVPNAGERESLAVLAQPGRQMIQRLLMADLLASRLVHMSDDLAFGVGCGEARLVTESLELPAEDTTRLARTLRCKDLKLQARGPRIEHQEDGRHASAPYGLKGRSPRMREQGSDRARGKPRDP